MRDRNTLNNIGLNERLYAIQDANWNVTAVTDSSGNVQERYAYLAYGRVTFLDGQFANSASASALAMEILFAGYHWEPSTGLILARYRFYSSPLGSWLQRDPMGQRSGRNLYEYTNSSPLISIDPFGLQEILLRPIPMPSPVFTPRPILIPPTPPVLPPLYPPVPIMINPPDENPSWPQGPDPEPKPPRQPRPNPGPGSPPPGGKPWKCPPSGRNKGSDCTPDELKSFALLIDAYCNHPGSPTSYPNVTSIYSSTWSCSGIEDLGNKWKKCANARKAREDKCFRGGDNTHKYMINWSEYQAAYAKYLLKYWECPGYWTPPRPPLIMA